MASRITAHPLVCAGVVAGVCAGVYAGVRRLCARPPRPPRVPAPPSPDASLAMARLVLPSDANLAGNCHGGVILWMSEQAGHIITTRHANKERKSDEKRLATMTARLERMAFLEPMYIGEVARISGKLTYASERSMQVRVHVEAENPLTGKIRHTNTAYLWYIAGTLPMPKSSSTVGTNPNMPLSLPNSSMMMRGKKFVAEKVPPIVPVTDDEIREYETAKRHYESRKSSAIKAPPLPDISSFDWDSIHAENTLGLGPRKVSESASSLMQLMDQTDSTAAGPVHGGIIMKLMDTAAGVTAFRHCKTNAVTALVDTLDFRTPIYAGDLCKIHAKITFTSARSMEVLVETWKEDPFASQEQDSLQLAVSAFFTFVSLDKQGRTLPIPPISPESDQEKVLFLQGQQRYTARKEFNRKKHKSNTHPGDKP